VRGVERLRVADASVLPTVPNGNVHATVVAVAHRAAEIIVAEAAGRSV
jgi:choline dehydrogenase